MVMRKTTKILSGLPLSMPRLEFKKIHGYRSSWRVSRRDTKLSYSFI